ncbi:MAG: sensor protein [Gemmatimonadetes bacterium]|nr:sensor protein [Gemmatimonadota bacterium]
MGFLPPAHQLTQPHTSTSGATDEISRAIDAGELASVMPRVLDLVARLEGEVEARTREIEEQRRFTQRIVDSLPLGLYVIDRDYRVQAWNSTREVGLQGVRREEAIGQTIFDVLHRQPADVLRREFDEVFATGQLQQFQMESRATGELRRYRLTKIPMRAAGGDVTHVITVGEDITEWKNAEERFTQAEKLAALGTLAAGVMHEINNPLATIAAAAEIMALKLDESPTPDPLLVQVRATLQMVDDEVQRCRRIAEGVLDFSRPKPVERSAVQVNETAERALFLLRHHPRFKRLDVELSLDRSINVFVWGSEEQLLQLLLALMLNALDAVEERGSIAVRTRRASGGDVVIEVEDGGIGMAPGELRKIFEPFYTTKPPGRGTGLGLSIAYTIAAEHGGRLEVESVPGTGSIFRLLLPPWQGGRDGDTA